MQTLKFTEAGNAYTVRIHQSGIVKYVVVENSTGRQVHGDSFCLAHTDQEIIDKMRKAVRS